MIVNSKAPINGRRPRNGNSKGKDDGDGGGGDDDDEHRIHWSNILAAWSTLWYFAIAMENRPFIDGLAIKHGDFPWLC